MFESLDKAQKFDLIVSNPPYIESGAIDALDDEIKLYEPLIALDGGGDGLKFYRIIAENAPEFLTRNGAVLLEIGSDQGAAVKALLDKNFDNIEIIKDYGGRDRIVFARKKQTA
jgi:release factor glutamine methyltransferase